MANTKMYVASSLIVTAIFAAGLLSYEGINASEGSGQWIGHTRDVQDKLHDLSVGVDSLEETASHLALTGDHVRRADIDATIRHIQQDQSALKELVSDNPDQELRLQTIDDLASRLIASAQGIVATRQSQGSRATEDAALVWAGEKALAGLRSVIGKMESEEARLLALRVSDAGRNFDRAKIIVVCGTAIGLVIALLAVVQIFRDGRGRRLAERDLRDGEEMYRAMIQGVRDYGIVMLDPKGTVLSWNSGAEMMTGCLASEMIGQPFSGFFLADDVARGRPAEILAAAASSGLLEVQGMRKRKDGKTFFVRASYTALHDARGGLRGFALISRDLTQSMESEARYRGLLEAAPDAMVVVNSAGEIVMLNARAEKQFGYHRDELLGQPVTNLIPEGFAERLVADDLRSAQDALNQTIGAGIELDARRKDGGEFPIEIMLSPLDSAEGVLVTAAIRDISVRRAADVLLLQKINELNRSNSELEQFAAIASHDLQEPLRMVASYTQLLSRRYKGKLDSDADEFIAFAVDGANRMKVLIRDLLAFSRINTRTGGLSDTSSEHAFLRALVNLRGAISESGALVTHDPLPGVLADETQLIQLFQNLVGNAIKYRKPGIPEVHVSATAAGAKQWVFAVQDNGMGIEPRYFERIFGMFQRLHKREDIEGTGIGLAICKKIVERHGGVISVASEPGQGSTFSFGMTRSVNNQNLGVAA